MQSRVYRDKARAFEVWARQAKNTEAEAMAARIRIRAEKKTGELLAESKRRGERHPQGGDQQAKSRRPILSDLGISRDQSSQWQKLADIPEEQFEAALAEGRPSTAGILRKCGQARQVNAATIPLCPHCGQPWPEGGESFSPSETPQRDG